MNKTQAQTVAHEITSFPVDYKSVTLAKLPSTGVGSDDISLTFDNKYKVKIAANGAASYSKVTTTTVEGFGENASGTT